MWEGGRVGPGQFEQFLVTIGPLPRDGRLAFTTTQHYSNGDADTWTAAGSGQRKSAAPAIKIGSGVVATPSASASPTTKDTAPVERKDPADLDDSTASAGESSDGGVPTLLLGLLLGGVGLVAVIAAVRYARTRRRAVPETTTEPANTAEPENTAAEEAEPAEASNR